MSGLSDEFITLTQLNCVQQCSALLQSPRPRNFIMAGTLFGLYCGVLIYRSYRSYQAKVEAKRQAELARTAMQAQLPTYEDYVYEIPAPERHDFHVPNIPEPILVEHQSTDDAITATS